MAGVRDKHYKRTINKRRTGLKKKSSHAADVNAEEIMTYLSSNNSDIIDVSNKKSGHKEELKNLKDLDPEFYKYLQENDKELLQFSESDVESEEEMEKEIEEEMNEMEEEDGNETYSAVEYHESNQEKVVDKKERVMVTVKLVNSWSERLKTNHSIVALTELTSALHSAVLSILSSYTDQQKRQQEQLSSSLYYVQGEKVFNAIVVACLRHVRQTLEHHLPPPPVTQSTNKLAMPSSLKKWRRLSIIIKSYLTDFLQLLKGVTDVSMVCALLRHIEHLWIYYCCYPKLSRLLNKLLISVWSESREEAAVIAFLILRKIYLSFNEHKKQETLKQLYLSYIRNSRFTSTSTLPHVRFMCGCLVDFLSLSYDHAYQLIFVYTRQLANQLRTAYSSKKVAIATWPFIHSLELFTAVLSCCTSDVLSPLIYPVTQVALGVVQVLPSTAHVPTRLHIVRMLLTVATETNTYIPLAPILLEILETQSCNVSHKTTTGKPPNLQCTLKFKKGQIDARGTQSAVLNMTIELLLRLLATHSHLISFPEMVFPTTIRIRKVIKTTPVTWLKHHLKQLVDKTEEVSKYIVTDRATLPFSPKDSEQIISWERQRKQERNALTNFLETWEKVQQQSVDQSKKEDNKSEVVDDTREIEEKRYNRKRKSRTNNRKTTKRATVIDWKEEEEDIVEDLELSSDEN